MKPKPMLKKLTQHISENWYKYGIETLVVVVGVLSAFALSNWNENHKAAKQELQILRELKTEIEANQEHLLQIIVEYDTIKAHAEQLSLLVSPESEIIDVERFNQLTNSLVYPPKYEPADGVLKSVISSGGLSLIESDELKYSLSSISGLINDYNHWVSIDLHNLRNINSPFIIKNYPLQNLPFLSNQLGKSKFDSNPHKLSRSMEFESMIGLRWINSWGLKSRSEGIHEVQASILGMIEEEISRLE